jgi:SSS family solute:Na+ symporter
VTVWLMKWADGYLFATIGILTSLIVGYLASWVLPSDKHDLDGLTLYTMRDR